MTLGPNWAELRKEVLELSEIWIVYPVYPNLGVAGIKFFENLTLAAGQGWPGPEGHAISTLCRSPAEISISFR